MPIFVGGTEITDIQIGNGDGTSTEINEVYVGANKVWERATTYSVTYEDQDDRWTNTATGGATQYNNHEKRGYVQDSWQSYLYGYGFNNANSVYFILVYRVYTYDKYFG